MEFKNIQKYCLLIGFEGMDASYKETNSSKLYSYLVDYYFKDLHKEGKLDIYYLSFPNYSSSSSYFVKKYLDGKYTGAGLELVTSFYLMDMYDTLRNMQFSKPTIIVFDRYYYSQMYYLTKKCYSAFDNNFISDGVYVLKEFINFVEEKAFAYGLPKLNFLYKMHNDLYTMIGVIRKRKQEKNLDIYEADIEYLEHVREVFLSENFINKDRLNNITGNSDILYNINVSNKDQNRVWDDVRVAISNTLENYKKILEDYYKKEESKEDV